MESHRRVGCVEGSKKFFNVLRCERCILVRSVGASRSRSGLRSEFFTNYAVPRLRTKFGERAFSHAGPPAWNALPDDIRATSDSVVLEDSSKLIILA